MLTAIEHSFLRVFPQKYRNRHWKKNLPIRRFQPSKIRGKAIICALGAYGLKNRGKLQPNLFLPPFCRMLGQCGIATSCITDFRSLGQELEISEGVPTVLISLMNETFDELDEYDVPEDLLKQANAMFNSHRTAGIIRDKRKANETLSRQGIMMPSLRIADEGKKIFSNARVGSGENAFVLEKLQDVDDGRYNAELIDTRIPFENSVYFTCVRLVCIGTRTLQIYVRARDVEENNPSVHNKDTPKILNFWNTCMEIWLRRAWNNFMRWVIVSDASWVMDSSLRHGRVRRQFRGLDEQRLIARERLQEGQQILLLLV